MSLSCFVPSVSAETVDVKHELLRDGQPQLENWLCLQSYVAERQQQPKGAPPYSRESLEKFDFAQRVYIQRDSQNTPSSTSTTILTDILRAYAYIHLQFANYVIE